MKNSNIKLGLFFTVGMLILITILYVLGAKQNFFEDNLEIKTYFKNALGLQKGGSVKFVGITIGSVDEISIINDTSVFVSLKIDKDHARFIYEDAVAEISSDGLMGNKMINIVPGPKSTQAVKDGDEISSRPPIGMETIMNSILNNSRNLESLTQSLVDIGIKISSGEGLVGKLLLDTTVGQKFDEMMLNTDLIVKNINSASEEIVGGEGTLSKLIYDTTYSANIAKIIDSLSATSANMAVATREISDFAIKLNTGEGSLSRFVNDTTMADNLNATIANAKDRTAELEETIAIVNDSWILNLFNNRNKKKKQKDKELTDEDEITKEPHRSIKDNSKDMIVLEKIN